MAVRKIIIYPDRRLRRTAQPVAQVTDEVRRLVDDMVETMYHAEGIGLAATQVGTNLRVLVMDVDREAEEQIPICMINPEIVATADEEHVGTEGCLSLPEINEEISRPQSVTIRYLDRSGDTQEQTFAELAAVCVQHEIDHLNGRLIIDYVGLVKRQQLEKQLARQKRTTEKARATA